jgi:hypothetical protein
VCIQSAVMSFLETLRFVTPVHASGCIAFLLKVKSTTLFVEDVEVLPKIDSKDVDK